MRVAASGGIDGRYGNVDAVRSEAYLAGKCAEVETVTAAGIENDAGGRWPQDLRNAVQQRPGYAAIVQTAARCDGGRRVSGLLRMPLLRLQQVDVAAARNVKQMIARADELPLGAHKWQAAIAHGAQEHGLSVAERRRPGQELNSTKRW